VESVSSSSAPTLSLATTISRSDALHNSLAQALEEGDFELPDDTPRSSVALDACNVALEHGAALRQLLANHLESSGLSMLRLQYEALLRAAWVLCAAKDRDVLALAAPLTTGTSKSAKSLPLSVDLLASVEKAEDAPAPLKRALREFRDRSWETLNSYVHIGIHPLRRASGGRPEHDLVAAVVASNALNYATFMLLATLSERVDLVDDINVITVARADCMPAERR
jgi:hypothetical protein